MRTSRPKIVFAILALACLFFAAYVFWNEAEKGKPIAFFAYGANLGSSTLRSRAGGFESAEPARLPGYRLEFRSNRQSEFGVADMVADANGSVAGGLYMLTASEAAALDKAEGVPGFYRKIGVVAVRADGKGIPAVAYVLAGTAHFAAPSRPYLNATVGALLEFGYGKETLDEVGAAALEASQKSARPA